MAATKLDAKPKFPKSLAACADLYYQTREKRLAMEKEVAEVQKLESALKQHLIDNVSADESATGVAGKVCRISVVKKETPRVEDWDKVFAYVKKTGSFDLLQRRLSTAAVQERWNHDKVIPGVEVYAYKDLSYAKV